MQVWTKKTNIPTIISRFKVADEELTRLNWIKKNQETKPDRFQHIYFKIELFSKCFSRIINGGE